MKEKVTPERVMELGEEWSKLLLRQMNAKERLAGLSAQDRLASISPEEVLAQYKPEEVLTRLPPEEIEAWLAKQRAGRVKTAGDAINDNSTRNN